MAISISLDQSSQRHSDRRQRRHKVSGSGDFGGDGVGADASPTTIISVGEDTVVDWAGSGNLFGLVCNMGGNMEFTGSGDIYGSVISAGETTQVQRKRESHLQR